MIVWSFAAAALPDLCAPLAQSASLRPYVHIFLAYAAAWILILFWAWRIFRGLKRLISAADEEAGGATGDG